MIPLTARQKVVMTMIADFIRARGYPPTLREICTVLGMRSTNSARCHLQSLERKRYIAHDTGSARSIRLLISPDQIASAKTRG